MALLTREKLLAKQKLQIEKVDLEGNDYVYVREMTGHERDEYEQALIRVRNNPDGTMTRESTFEDFRAKLLVRTLCDKDGNNLLQPTDVATLAHHIKGSWQSKLYDKAQELSKIGKEELERLAKNSADVPSDDSGSDSAGS